MKKDSSKLPPEKLTAYERWELPVMGDSPEKNQLPTAKLPTASELQAIQKAAYKEGFQAGKEAGNKAGFEQGSQQGLQSGAEEGFMQGSEQGRIEAMAAKQSEIDAQLQQVGQLMEALQLPLKEVKGEAEEAVVNLVLAVSRAVVFRELQLERSQISRVVSEALATLPLSEEQATVYIHPKDLEFLKTHQPPEEDYRFVADPALMAGGCRVETRHSLLDFTVEKRFQVVVQQMLSGQSSQSDDPDAHDYSEQMGEMTDLHRTVLETAAAEGKENPARVENNLAVASEPRPSVIVADHAAATEPERMAGHGKETPDWQRAGIDSAESVDPALREGMPAETGKASQPSSQSASHSASHSSGRDQIPHTSKLGGLDDG